MTEHSNPTLSPVAATTPRPRPRASRRGDGRLVPAGLIALTVVPLIAGAVRLTKLFTGGRPPPEGVPSRQLALTTQNLDSARSTEPHPHR